MAEEDLKVKASLEDELTRPLDKVEKKVKDVGQATKQADDKARTYNATLGKLAGRAGSLAGLLGRGLATAAKVGAAGIGLVTAAAVVAGVKLVGLASDAAETASKFDTVFAGNASAVSKWVKETNAAYGITTKSLQDVTSRFGVFGKAAGIAADDLPGFSTKLAQAGLDLSSFYNVDPEEAFLALSSGLAGETEPLRQYGIFLSEASMKAAAAQEGLTGELTESQKVMLRQKIILASLGDAEGDLERTKDSLSNKTRALRGRFTELGTQIGTVFLPIAGKLFSWLDGKLSPVVTRLTDAAPKLSEALGAGNYLGVAFQVDQLAGAGGRLVGFYVRARDLWGELRSGWADSGLSGVVSALDDAVGAGGRLSDAFETVVQMGRDLVTIYQDGVAPGLADLGPVGEAILSPLTLVDNVLGFLADHAGALTPIVTVAAGAWAGYTLAVNLAAAGQWAMNAATSANPYVLFAMAVGAVVAALYVLYQRFEAWRPVIVAVGVALAVAFGGPILAVAAFVAAIVLAYKKVGWFRTAVDAVGRFLKGVFLNAVNMVKAGIQAMIPVVQAIGRFLSSAFGVAKTVVEALIPWVQRAIDIFRIIAAIHFAILITAINGIITAVGWLWDKSEPVRKLLGDIAGVGFDALVIAFMWVRDKAVELWDKTEPLRDILETIGGMALEGIKSALKWIGDKIDGIVEGAKGFIDTLSDMPGGGIVKGIAGIVGDTARPRAAGAAHGHARGRGMSGGAARNLANTMATYRRVDAMTPGKRSIASSWRSWALGSSTSDHVTGRALDVVGSNLNGFAQNLRREGGFAEHHGDGGSRHLHAASGDTARPRAGAGTADTGGTLIVIEPGAILVDRPASNVELSQAIRQGIADYERDRKERGR